MLNPIEIFKENWEKAKSKDDANANYCSLATLSESDHLSIRTLVLRKVTEDSFLIFINNTSSKWQDLVYSKHFEILVFWPSLMQQYRIRGTYSEMDIDELKIHWEQKPYDSKIIDHYYTEYFPQSSVIESREFLLKGIEELKVRYPSEADIPFPENAKGVSIKASYLEVWHGSISDRLHYRNLYILSEGVWSKQTLVP